jgi:hypothetical protein
MRGTRKQITWAQDLTNKAMAAFEIALNTKGIPARAVEYINIVTEAINSAEYAGDVIALLKDAKGEGLTYMQSVFSEIKINGENAWIINLRNELKKH